MIGEIAKKSILRFAIIMNILSSLATVYSKEPLIYSLNDYIIKWEFYKYCQFGYDPETSYESFPLSLQAGGITFDPSQVKKGDLIFLRARYTQKFFEQVVPRIQEPFIIIAHGEYLDGCQDYFSHYLDHPKLMAWFGTHPCSLAHRKFHPIPLGVWPHRPLYQKKAEMASLFAQLRATHKKKLVYANFADWVHPERKKVKDLFADQAYCTFRSRIPFVEYLHEMAEHKFTFSPRGLGPDCYRTWEALLVGSIPIVRRSHLDPMYEGLPVLIVDEWEIIDQQFLEKKYEEMTAKNYDLRKLSIEYWLQEIKKVT